MRIFEALLAFQEVLCSLDLVMVDGIHGITEE